MPFSKEFIEQIKQRNRIEDAVARVATLKRAGSNLVCCCPFHSEKTPSFTVFPAEGRYYCFGCHAGGDIITFTEQTEGLEYRDAVERLARSAGIPMEEDAHAGTRTRSIPRERLFEVNREAARFFWDALNSPEGAEARSYLLEKRKFEKATIRRFGIGYAPDAWSALTDHMTGKGFTREELTAAFLSGVSRKTGNLYDIFRNRLMFPVFDLNGEVAAFSGRRMNEAEERKYINTSDTPVFKKSRILFGMHIAKKHAEKGIILCEGAPDCIAMHQAGFENAAATLGTAITGEHARMISRFTKQVYLAYDIDAAGRKATLRGIELLQQVGVDAKVVNLGEGDSKDPDEFIKNHGADAFRRKVEGSQGQVDYRINEIVSRYDLTNPDEKLRCAGELVSFISTLGSRLERDVYAQRAAEKLRVEPRSVREEVDRANRIAFLKERKKENGKLIEKQSGVSDAINLQKVRMVSEASHEEAIIGILLLHPEFGEKAVKKLDPDDFATDFNRKVWTVFSPDWENGEEPDINGHGQLKPAEVSEIAGYRASVESLGGGSDTELYSHIEALKRAKAKKEEDRRMAEDPEAALNEALQAARAGRGRREDRLKNTKKTLE
ncbi:MAG: DNA primase [Clostridia bacterium]|nr:DNA primase [Clostridia bacterium]